MVGAENEVAVINLYKALEGSPLFGGILQQNSLPPTQAEPLFRYRVMVNYAQQL